MAIDHLIGSSATKSVAPKQMLQVVSLQKRAGHQTGIIISEDPYVSGTTMGVSKTMVMILLYKVWYWLSLCIINIIIYTQKAVIIAEE